MITIQIYNLYCYIQRNSVISVRIIFPWHLGWEFPWRTPYPSFWASWDYYPHGFVQITIAELSDP